MNWKDKIIKLPGEKKIGIYLHNLRVEMYFSFRKQDTIFANSKGQLNCIVLRLENIAYPLD